MSDGKEEEGGQEIQVSFVETKTDIPTIYVNNARFTTSQWDMRIDISELYDLNVENKTMSVIPRARLIMDFRFAARFIDAMKNNLDQVVQAMERHTKQASQANPPKED